MTRPEDSARRVEIYFDSATEKKEFTEWAKKAGSCLSPYIVSKLRDIRAVEARRKPTAMLMPREIESLREENRIIHLEENQSIQATLISKLKSRIDPVAGEEVKRREDILKGLLVLNGGKMGAKEARQKMKLDKATFSRLIAHLEGVEVRPMKTDGRKHILILQS